MAKEATTKKKTVYTQEFKATAIKLALAGNKSMVEVANLDSRGNYGSPSFLRELRSLIEVFQMTDGSTSSAWSELKTIVFSTLEIVRDSWRVLMGAVFVREVISTAAAGLVVLLLLNISPWNLAAGLFARGLIWCMLQCVFMSICLKSAKRENVLLPEIISCIGAGPQLLLSTFLLSCSCLIGLTLLIIPGLILMVRCSVFGVILIDQKLGPCKSLLASFRVSGKFAWLAAGLLFISYIGESYLEFLYFILEPCLMISLCLLYIRSTRKADS